MIRTSTLGVLLVLAMTGAASAQPTAVDPIQCWWRTNPSAVRVGETFSVVLTCAVVENDAIIVVPDQAPLDPSAAQLPPFDVVGGSHGADLRSADRRFFQYEYRLRIVSEDLFGKDVKLPDTKITYRVQSRVGDSSIEGIERTYFLPSLSVRVLSLVPGDATDIRDASTTTFSDVDAPLSRATILIAAASVLFFLAGLVVIVAFARYLGRFRTAGPAAKQLVPDAAILRAVGRELAAIRRERAGGWTPALTNRLVTMLRILAGYALTRPFSQVVLADRPGLEQLTHQHGHLLIRRGWTTSKTVTIAGSATPQGLAAELAHQSVDLAAWRWPLVDALQRALSVMTVAQYGREMPTDDLAIDAAVDTAAQAVRQLRLRNTWPMKQRDRLGRMGTALGQRVWSR